MRSIIVTKLKNIKLVNLIAISAIAILIVTVIGVDTKVAQAVSLGGHGAVDGNSGWSSTSPGRELIDHTNTLSAGTVRSAQVYFSSAGGAGQSIRIKVWRQNGANLDLVGESGVIDVSNHALGTVTVTLPSPIVAQAGDFPGITLLPGTSNLDAQTGAFTTLYRTGDTVSGSIAQSSFGTDGSAPAIEFFSTAPVTVTTLSSLGGFDNDSSVSLTINGSGFLTGATVKLSKTGSPDITASNVQVVTSSQITADFNLNGASLGYWDLTVTNLDATTYTKTSAFKVYQSGQAKMGGFDAVDGSSGYSPGGAPGRELVDRFNTLAEGTAKSGSIYISNTTGAGASIIFKVWRQNGTNLDLVGNSGSIDVSNLSAGAYTFPFPTPITAQFGDYAGVYISTTGNVNIDATPGSYNTLYRTGNTLSGSVAQSSFTSDNGFTFSIALFNVNSLTSINPSSGINNGPVSTTILGGSFVSGVTAKLTKTGQPDINATSVTVNSATSISASFDLTGKAFGKWSVVVTYPDTSTATIIDGFRINDNKLFMGIGDSIAEGHPAYHGPEHTGPSGNVLSEPWRYLADEIYWSYYNAGIGGNTASQVNSRIQALLDSKNPDTVYLHVGINDIATGVTLTSYLSTLDSILSKVTASGATLVIGQIIPDNEGSKMYIEDSKLWNASIEQWALDNNVKVAPTFLEMSDNSGSNDDAMLASYVTGDQVHPTVTGYAKLGYLYAQSALPSKKLSWGDTSFPTMSHNSIRWFLLGGGATVTGNSDTGSLSLPLNSTAVSNVFTLPPGSKPVTIKTNSSSGSVTLSYRTSPTNFTRNDGVIPWTAYTDTVTIPSDQFFQFKITGADAGTSVVTDATVYWSDVPTISAISAGTPTQTDATITWTTSVNGDSQVFYGLTNAYGSQSALNATQTTSHSTALSGLTAGTTYHYKVVSTNAYGNYVSSTDQTFTTQTSSHATSGSFIAKNRLPQQPTTPDTNQPTQQPPTTNTPQSELFPTNLKIQDSGDKVKNCKKY